MADPLTILGATASAITIIEVLSKSISALDGLRTQWNTADYSLLSLTSQLRALNAALFKIDEWQHSGSSELHHQLVSDLNSSLECCHILASKMQEEIADLQKGPSGALFRSSKAKLTFKKTGLSELQGMVDRQTSTLTLLLTACNSNSLAKQQEIVGDSSVRKRISTLKSDAASLICHADSASVLTRSTQRSSKLSMLFDFDDELFASEPYKKIIRKTVKFTIRSHKRRGSDDILPSVPSSSVPRASDAVSPRPAQGPGSTNILLLGVGGSSKTTFCKQIGATYSPNKTNETYDLLEWKAIICDNLRTAFRMLLSIHREEGFSSLSATSESILADERAALLIQSSMESAPPDSYPPGFAETLEKLVNNLKSVDLLHTEMCEMADALDYFLKHLPRVCAEEYRPREEDIIHARVRTTGMHLYSFNVYQHKYNVYDVGGERSERKKWTRIMQIKHDVVIHFIPICGYGQGLSEDLATDQLQEALALFEQSVNSQYLGQAQHNLCFTKMDIFEGKVRSGTNPISDVFPEYSGSTTDVDAVRDFITAKFTQLLKCSAPRELRVYYLNAVDREEVRQVMGNILERADMFAPHFTFTKYPDEPPEEKGSNKRGKRGLRKLGTIAENGEPAVLFQGQGRVYG